MKKILLFGLITVLSVSIVVSFSLVGCKEEVAPVEEEEVMEEVEEVAEEEEAPPAEEEVVEEAEVDYKLAIYMPIPNPWFEKMQDGIDAFTADTGIPVHVQYGTEWAQEDENQMVEGLIAQGYNGISISPCDPSGANSLLQEMIDQGVKVTCHSTLANLPTPAPFQSTPDLVLVAKEQTIELCKAMGEKGGFLNFLDDPGDPNQKVRGEAVKEELQNFPDVEFLGEIGGITSLDEGISKISAAIASYGDDLDGFTVHGATAGIAGSAVLTQLENDAEEGIIFVSHMDTPEVLKSITDGYVYTTWVQNAYAVGYISAMLLKLQLDGYTPKEDYAFINAWGTFAYKDTIEDGSYVQELIDGSNEIVETLAEDYFNPPAK